MLTILLDFDGVIHSYKSGWKGPAVIPDPPVSGAIESLLQYLKKFEVCIYSSRSKYWRGRRAMKKWLKRYLMEYAETAGLPKLEFGEPWYIQANDWSNDVIGQIKWPTKKPAAFLTIDDRCVCFDGTFPSAEEIASFLPWNKSGA